MSKACIVWVLRDLSNGNGADGRDFPTYIWVFPTKKAALKTSRVHRCGGGAELGPLERWPKSTVYRLYDQGNWHFDGWYCSRRSDDWLD